jgi:hypothetical protein
MKRARRGECGPEAKRQEDEEPVLAEKRGHAMNVGTRGSPVPTSGPSEMGRYHRGTRLSQR